MTTKTEKEKGTEFLPATIIEIAGKDDRTTIEKYSYGFVFIDELDKLLEEITGIDGVTAKNIVYMIGDKYTTKLVTEDFEVIDKKFSEKAYPIKFYNAETEELLGFVFLSQEILDDIGYLEPKTDLSDFYDAVVENQEDDIRFQYMVKTL